jgi:hypothetical protein
MIDGAARIFDFSGRITRRNLRFTHRSDRDSLRADWEAVGGDLRWAINDFATESGMSVADIDRSLAADGSDTSGALSAGALTSHLQGRLPL